MSEKPVTPEQLESLRRRIDSANVSEAAKEFYREYLLERKAEFPGFRSYLNNLGDRYSFLKELDDAGLIMISVALHDRDSGSIVY